MTLAETLLFLLNESRKDRYLQMSSKPMSKLTGEARDEFEYLFESEVDWAISNLKREDRIIWYLRYATYHNWSKINQRYGGTSASQEALSLWHDQMVSRYGFAEKGHRLDGYVLEHLDDLRGVFEYFLGMPIPAIQEMRFTTQGLEIFNEMKKIADEFAENRDGLMLSDEEEGRHAVETFVELDNGWKWVLKHTDVCQLEGNAMDHCGNAGRHGRDDKILSLREPTGDPNKWRPHLTAVLTKDNAVIGMVGRSNSQPSPKYSKHVEALFSDPRVKSIESWYNVPDSARNAVLSRNPDLKVGK